MLQSYRDLILEGISNPFTKRVSVSLWEWVNCETVFVEVSLVKLSSKRNENANSLKHWKQTADLSGKSKNVNVC